MSPEYPPEKPVKMTQERFDRIYNQFHLNLAKHEAVVEGWIAKSARANEPRKTDAELDAEDAALFRPQPPYLGLGAPIPPEYLNGEHETNHKALRAQLFPSKTLKASKARDAEEKAASKKRGLAMESSDEEEGRSGLGRAKKLKKGVRMSESVKKENGTSTTNTRVLLLESDSFDTQEQEVAIRGSRRQSVISKSSENGSAILKSTKEPKTINNKVLDNQTAIEDMAQLTQPSVVKDSAIKLSAKERKKAKKRAKKKQKREELKVTDHD